MVWPPDPGAVGAPVSALDTPCLVLDLDAVERNLDRITIFFGILWFVCIIALNFLVNH